MNGDPSFTNAYCPACPATRQGVVANDLSGDLSCIAISDVSGEVENEDGSRKSDAVSSLFFSLFFWLLTTGYWILSLRSSISLDQLPSMSCIAGGGAGCLDSRVSRIVENEAGSPLAHFFNSQFDIRNVSVFSNRQAPNA